LRSFDTAKHDERTNLVIGLQSHTEIALRIEA
jgi:hypothetical protein